MHADTLVRKGPHATREASTEYSDWQVTRGHTRECPLPQKSAR